MIQLKIIKTLAEQGPSLVSSCLRFLGKEVPATAVEDCLVRDWFKNLSLDDILDISAYSSLFEVIQSMKEEKHRMLSSSIITAWCVFLVKRMSVRESWVRDDVDLRELLEKLDEIFLKASKAPNVNAAIKQVYRRIKKLDFMRHGSEAFLFVLVNFYLYTFKGEIILLEDSIVSKDAAIEELQIWIDGLEVS